MSEEYFEKLSNETQEYIRQKTMYTRLVFTEKTAKMTSLLILYFVLFFILLMMAIFASFMLGYYFSELFRSYFYGFGALVGVYTFFFLLISVVFKKAILRKLNNTIIQVLLNDEE